MNEGKRRYRRYKRFIVENMDIHAKALFAMEVKLFDISTGGACIKATKILKLGGKYLIRLESDGKLLPLQSTAIWANLSESVKNARGEFMPVYKSGIAFKDTSSDKLVKLKDFIRVSGIPNEQRLSDKYRPSALRFKIYTNEKAVLNYPKTFTVKKVSLGGMLVETNYEIQIESRFLMALFPPDENLPIKFQGRIASCIEIPDKKSKNFDIGTEFLNMADNDRARLSKFIQFLHEI